MQRIESKNFVSPSLCGCVVKLTTTWGAPIEDIDMMVKDYIVSLAMDASNFIDPKDMDAFENHIREDFIKAKQDTEVKIEATAVVAQCKTHNLYNGPVELYDELKNLVGNVYRPDTCDCSVYYWFDKRNFQNITHRPTEHHAHTRRCQHHSAASPIAHHAAVMAENRAKNIAVNQAALDYGVSSEDVPYTFNAQRKVVIDQQKLSLLAADAQVMKVQ